MYSERTIPVACTVMFCPASTEREKEREREREDTVRRERYEGEGRGWVREEEYRGGEER